MLFLFQLSAAVTESIPSNGTTLVLATAFGKGQQKDWHLFYRPIKDAWSNAVLSGVACDALADLYLDYSLFFLSFLLPFVGPIDWRRNGERVDRKKCWNGGNENGIGFDLDDGENVARPMRPSGMRSDASGEYIMKLGWNKCWKCLFNKIWDYL